MQTRGEEYKADKASESRRTEASAAWRAVRSPPHVALYAWDDTLIATRSQTNEDNTLNTGTY